MSLNPAENLAATGSQPGVDAVGTSPTSEKLSQAEIDAEIAEVVALIDAVDRAAARILFKDLAQRGKDTPVMNDVFDIAIVYARVSQWMELKGVHVTTDKAMMLISKISRALANAPSTQSGA